MAALQFRAVDSPVGLLTLAGKNGRLMHLRMVDQDAAVTAVAASLESTKILLAKGADPNAKSETGGTVLMAAASRSPQAVGLLVARGADVTVLAYALLA